MTHIPEAIVTEILARLPLRSIHRFKAVCKAWHSLTGSAYFRCLFLSLHQNTSPSWSLIPLEIMGKELMGLHGCETWNLPNSPASYIPPFLNPRTGAATFASSPTGTATFASLAYSNGLVLMEGYGCCFVGNPILQQWVRIPSPTRFGCVLGLMTRVDKDGVVLDFKVVRLRSRRRAYSMMRVLIYSSETGVWTSKRLHCPPHHTLDLLSPMTLNGCLYVMSGASYTGPEVLLAHDFYSESDRFRAIPLPDQDGMKALSTSGGYVTLAQKVVGSVLRVWKLNNDESSWQLLWDIHVPFIPWGIGHDAPMAMHPFDTGIVYLWSGQCLASLNLRTKKYRTIEDASRRFDSDDHQQHCFMNRTVCKKYMNYIWGPNSFWQYRSIISLSQFVLPRWIEPVPCPPNAERIDTTSLLSYITST